MNRMRPDFKVTKAPSELRGLSRVGSRFSTTWFSKPAALVERPTRVAAETMPEACRNCLRFIVRSSSEAPDLPPALAAVVVLVVCRKAGLLGHRADPHHGMELLPRR